MKFSRLKMRFICPVNKHERIFAENSHEKHQAILDEDESAEGLQTSHAARAYCKKRLRRNDGAYH